MAEGSKTTLVIELSRLPIFNGADKIARKPFLTRASATNASYVAPLLKEEGNLDPVLLEFFYDAQTSGGLLISVLPEKADLVVQKCRERGAGAAAVVGEVVERQEAALVIRG
jgi:selenide,water dikinase